MTAGLRKTDEPESWIDGVNTEGQDDRMGIRITTKYAKDTKRSFAAKRRKRARWIDGGMLKDYPAEAPFT
jgi:hypothetical protein